METEYFIILAGDGESSRANTEALMEDYIYANGLGGTLVLAYDDKPSKSQVVAAMYAKEKGLDLLVFCEEDADNTGIPTSSVYFDPHPHRKALESLSADKTAVFVLGVEGETSKRVIGMAREVGLKIFNLCQGLIEIGEVTYSDFVAAVTHEQLLKEAEIKEREVEQALTPAVKDLGNAMQHEVDWQYGGSPMPKPVVEALVNLFKVAQAYGLSL